MASTLSNLLYHFVFSTKYRKPVINSFKDELYKYITGSAKGEGARLISIGGMPDHVHIAIRLLPRYSVSKVLQSIKGSSSKWINDSVDLMQFSEFNLPIVNTKCYSLKNLLNQRNH